MGEPSLIPNRVRAELDETCEKIIDALIIEDVYIHNKLRYNQVFRKITKLIKISKPTFTDHLRHLIKKKMVIRNKAGKQEVYLYLNHDHPQILNAKEMAEEIQQEAKELWEIMKDTNRLSHLPIFLSHWFTICELRRWRTMFKSAFNHERKNDNILSTSLQAKLQAWLQDMVMYRLFSAINQAHSTEKAKEMIDKIIRVIDQAITQTNAKLLSLMEAET